MQVLNHTSVHHSNLEIDRLKQKLRQTDDRIEDLEGKTFPSLTLIDSHQDFTFHPARNILVTCPIEFHVLLTKESSITI